MRDEKLIAGENIKKGEELVYNGSDIVNIKNFQKEEDMGIALYTSNAIYEQVKEELKDEKIFKEISLLLKNAKEMMGDSGNYYKGYCVALKNLEDKLK